MCEEEGDEEAELLRCSCELVALAPVIQVYSLAVLISNVTGAPLEDSVELAKEIFGVVWGVTSEIRRELEHTCFSDT